MLTQKLLQLTDLYLMGSIDPRETIIADYIWRNNVTDLY